MTSPVFRALVSARLQQLTRDEAAISEDVNAALGPKPADTHRPARFIRWCEDQSLPWRPAQPATIAKWVLSHTETKHLPDELRTLALSHTSQGLPDPTSAWPVGEALSRVVKVETPRSWPKDMQVLFLSLPADIQAQITSREKERDVALRRSQNDAALWRKHIETEKLEEKNVIAKEPAEKQTTDAGGKDIAAQK